MGWSESLDNNPWKHSRHNQTTVPRQHDIHPLPLTTRQQNYIIFS